MTVSKGSTVVILYPNLLTFQKYYCYYECYLFIADAFMLYFSETIFHDEGTYRYALYSACISQRDDRRSWFSGEYDDENSGSEKRF